MNFLSTFTANNYNLYPKINLTLKIMPVRALLLGFQRGDIVRVEMLQRALQEEGWTKQHCKRAIEYLESLFNGLAASQPFILVPRKIIIDNLEKEIVILQRTIDLSSSNSNVEGEKALKSQLEVILDQLNKDFKDATFIVLDGQNRLFYAITKFFIGQQGKDSKWLAKLLKTETETEKKQAQVVMTS